MAIGDLLFSLMGKPNPMQQLAQSMGQFPGQAGSNSGPVPGPGAGAAAPGLAAQGGGGNVPGQPPQQQQPPPQPQAYTSPPDLGQMYMNLMQRQQANAQINVGLGLLAGAFSHNQADRSNMISAMENLNQSQGMGGAGGIGAIAQLQQMAWQRQMMLMQMQHLPAIAQELKISPEMATGLFMSGKLGDVMQTIAQSQFQQGTPEYQATVKKTLADAGLATGQAGAIPSTVAKTQAETQQIIASMPKTAAEIAQIQATTTQTLQNINFPTDQAKNYGFYANQELQGKRTPVSFQDWVNSGGTNPTEQQKDYRLAMSQLPEGMQRPSFDQWTANNAAMREAATQSALLGTQQKMNAQAALPDATDKIEQQIRLADEISRNAGLGDLTGAWGAHVGKMAAGLGLGQADLQAKVDQLAGSAGVSAVESLKGVGRILGTEFAAGTEAQSRLHDQQVNAKQYQGAIVDYRNQLAKQLRVVYQKAGAIMPPELDKLLQVTAPSAAAIEHLKANPKLRDDFDAKYGTGQAARALGM